MNKKLPNIYHNNENLVSNNKDSYYSFSKEKKENTIKEEVKSSNDFNNFFKYFNKVVNITTIDGNILNTKILSKIDDRILLEDGSYLNLSEIKKIN